MLGSDFSFSMELTPGRILISGRRAFHVSDSHPSGQKASLPQVSMQPKLYPFPLGICNIAFLWLMYENAMAIVTWFTSEWFVGAYIRDQLGNYNF